MAGPGFHRGCQLQSWALTYYFTKFCQKLHKNESIWIGEAHTHVSSAPPGSANVGSFWKLGQKHLLNPAGRPLPTENPGSPPGTAQKQSSYIPDLSPQLPSDKVEYLTRMGSDRPCPSHLSEPCLIPIANQVFEIGSVVGIISDIRPVKHEAGLGLICDNF